MYLTIHFFHIFLRNKIINFFNFLITYYSNYLINYCINHNIIMKFKHLWQLLPALKLCIFLWNYWSTEDNDRFLILKVFLTGFWQFKSVLHPCHTGLVGLDPIGSDPLGFFKKTHLKQKHNFADFWVFQFSKIFVRKTDKNKINAYAI